MDSLVMDSSLSEYWNNLLSWGGVALLVVGAKLIGDKKVSGFIISILSRLMWMIWAYRLGINPLFIMNIMMIIVYVYNTNRWLKEDKKNDDAPPAS